MANSKIEPCLRGIIDTLMGSELLRRSKIPHRNRLAVILIDSAFETACRAYLQHKEHIKLQDTHKHRDNLISTMKSKLTGIIDDDVWESINYYYTEIRCDFYHESASKTIIDADLLDYKEIVEFVINKAFEINIAPIVDDNLDNIERQSSIGSNQSETEKQISIGQVQNKADKMIVALYSIHPRTVKDLNEYFRKEGDSLRLKGEEFTQIFARNTGTRKMFYYDKLEKKWKLSTLGQNRLNEIRKGL